METCLAAYNTDSIIRLTFNIKISKGVSTRLLDQALAIASIPSGQSHRLDTRQSMLLAIVNS